MAVIYADVLVPEPTDFAWPKWAGYALAGTAASAVLYYAGAGNESYPGPLVYTVPDKTQPFYNTDNNYDHYPGDPIIPKSPWAFGILLGSLELLSDYKFN